MWIEDDIENNDEDEPWKAKMSPPRSFGACQRRYHFAVDGQHGSTSSTLSSTPLSS